MSWLPSSTLDWQGFGHSSSDDTGLVEVKPDDWSDGEAQERFSSAVALSARTFLLACARAKHVDVLMAQPQCEAPPASD